MDSVKEQNKLYYDTPIKFFVACSGIFVPITFSSDVSSAHKQLSPQNNSNNYPDPTALHM